MRKEKILAILLSIIMIFVLGACEQGGGPAAQTVEAYLKSLVAQDGATISNLSCSEWESQALMEMDSFQAVKPTLVGMACSQTGEDGNAALVDCEGKIVTTYDTEVREFDLSIRTYKVQKEGGEWRVCGYK